MSIHKPRGTNDILPDQVAAWHNLEKTVQAVAGEYGYREIRTPIFEHTELFARGVGEHTDIVEKEMYTFLDRGSSSLTLRPEGTAPIVRAFVENGLYNQVLPCKVYYLGPMFRYDRPQAGRYRQFHQFGVEALGSADPLLDAEMIKMADEVCRRLGITQREMHINSLGCRGCRPAYIQKLRQHLQGRLAALCDNCRARFDRNPLRVLDCKNEACRRETADSPAPVDSLCADCAAHFAAVLNGLQALELQYVVDMRLVRGLDYYTLTAFEIMVSEIGAQSSIGGGGRYDRLVEECGGPATPGVGFAFGLERLLLAREQQAAVNAEPSGLEVFIAALAAADRIPALQLAAQLREQGISVELDFLGRSLKAQMKFAGKIGARLVVIIGGEEATRDAVVVRDMRAAKQQELQRSELAGFLVETLEQ